MYQCTQCGTVQSDPVPEKDGYDGEIYYFCRFCGGRAAEPLEHCRNCGKELFPEEHAYEFNKNIYCSECVEEIII